MATMNKASDEPGGSRQSFPSDVPYLVRRVLAPTTRLRAGALKVTLPDGRLVHLEGREPGRTPSSSSGITVSHGASWRRERSASEKAICRGNGIPRSETLIELMSVNRAVIDEVMPGQFWQRMIQLLAHALNRNTRLGARQNIRAHYDLGNAFYQTWLDNTMTYSSAVFAPGDNDLAAAQARKYRLLAERAGVRPGESVLEIGCGWGGFAEFAAKELGCKVTGLTISKEQFDFATERMRKAGLDDRVTIALRDYRDEQGVFDRIVSIEMFEAVGEGFWPGFSGRCASACARAAPPACK